MILITGGSGFIGSHLTEELVRQGNKVKILIRKEEKLKNIPEKTLKKIKIVHGDLLNKDSLIKALKGVKKVFHLAAIARPMNVPKHAYYNINLTGTKNLLEACKINKVTKLIHVSTMSVFGYSRDRKPLTENSPKLPVSDYGMSKKLGEDLVFKFCEENKLKLVVVRPPMVFGPRDPQFFKLFKLINTGFFPLFKGGRAKFEFTYVKNLVSGIILADKKGKDQNAYNLSDGKTYTIKEAFSKIAKYENKRLFPISPPVFAVRLAGLFMELLGKLFKKHPLFNSGTVMWMINDNIIDISKAKKELGYKRIIPLDQSIQETIKYYKQEGFL